MATILPGYYVQSLGALTELRRSLGRDWILGSGHGCSDKQTRVKQTRCGWPGRVIWTIERFELMRPNEQLLRNYERLRDSK